MNSAKMVNRIVSKSVLFEPSTQIRVVLVVRVTKNKNNPQKGGVTTADKCYEFHKSLKHNLPTGNQDTI